MKLLCCMVTHNRFEYTKRAIEAYVTTTDEPLVVIDNASTDGTVEYLAKYGSRIWPAVNRRNLFPGAATNLGWHSGVKSYDAELLMRLDNDIELLPGWREEVERCFERVDNLGLLGIHNRHEDYDGHPPMKLDDTGTVNIYADQVGGNCVIPRTAWDHGLRWHPGAWSPGGYNEDTVFAQEVHNLGGLVGLVVPTIANNMSYHRYEDYPDYYDFTAGLRGLVPQLSV